jgi:hypothetical protein
MRGERLGPEQHPGDHNRDERAEPNGSHADHCAIIAGKD